jgi:putative addiction module antidote
MSNRKFDVRLRKVGNSYVVTIPKDTVDRFNLEEGDYLAIDFDTNEIKKEKKKNEKSI